jgi:hypothetical protein
MADKSRKMYHEPHLVSLGDLRTLTLGGSVGTGDSGGSGGYTCYPGGSGCVVNNAQKYLPPVDNILDPAGILPTPPPIYRQK